MSSTSAIHCAVSLPDGRDDVALRVDARALGETPFEAAVRNVLDHIGDPRGLEQVIGIERIDESSAGESNALVQVGVGSLIGAGNELERDRAGTQRFDG